MTFKHTENNNYCHFNVRSLAAEMRFECLFLCYFLVFSVITMSLRPQTQGNIWLFDDTVLITRKASGMSDKTSLLPIILFNYPYCYFYIESSFKNVIIYNLMQYLYTSAAWSPTRNVILTHKISTVVLSIYFHITDLSFQPSVQFPKSLLTLSENTTISMLSAYMTVPTLPTEKDSNFFTLNLSGKGGKMNLKKRINYLLHLTTWWCRQI